MIGGLSSAKPTNAEIEEIVSSVRNNFQEANYNTDKFETHSYKSQVVNGTNFFVKVETDKEFVHLRIHQALPNNESVVSLHSQQNNKTKQDEINYF